MKTSPYIKITEDGLTIRLPYRTINGNYLIYDDNFWRFVSSSGSHLRWVTDDEADYLTKVLETISNNEIAKFPKVKDRPYPIEVIVWEHVEEPEFPELSNNGGSYAYLSRIVKRSGWDREWENGFFLVENHLYGSDFSGQGWSEKGFTSESEAMAYIETFITVVSK